MTNYKPIHGRIRVNFGGVTTLIHPDDDVVTLQIVHAAGAAPLSMKTIDASQSKYVVPAGRNLWILGFKVLTNGTAGGNFWIYEGATDAATTTVKSKLSLTAIAGWFEWALTHGETIGGGKYVVSDPSTTQIEAAYLVGYLRDQ